jgi:alkanesulfonate monooxygenase SsuD/methylene tetrahydromethanopterin reductase-like flavin-dependent oxidoreductase (luciferase family)/hemerythrin-like domain-containing protein
VNDHPHAPQLYEAWTMLSVIAARTQTVKVTANVTSLPLRHPVVLARTVSTLDLITGGRVELALGAGSSLAAVAANSGPRMTVGESIVALEEAMAIIRAVWTPQEDIQLSGKHYTMMGAQGGPSPAHDVEIWLGAFKPRMLALTGRLADGWLPTSVAAMPAQLTAMNRIIDDSAIEAGRDPSSVRRLYNVRGRFDRRGGGFLQGPEEQWIEQLTELTLTEGMSTYILISEDPDDIRRFADVAEGVQEAVGAARSGAPLAPVSAAPPTAASKGAFTLVPTPAPTVRRSQVRPWDESDRPTGPVPETGRTYSPQQLASGQGLIEAHDHLRAELEQVRELVEQVAAGSIGVGRARSEINNMVMRQNNWTLGVYCESYCRLVTTHHSVEDASLFPRLSSADSRLVPVVDRLEQEHRVIHDVLEGVDRALVALVDGSGDIAGLRAAVDLVNDRLLSHLSYEEQELVEPMARLDIV